MKFTVYGTLHTGVFTIVDAPNKREAKRLALERGIISLCHACGGSEEEAIEEWCLGDGTNGDVTVSKNKDAVEIEDDE